MQTIRCADASMTLQHFPSDFPRLTPLPAAQPRSETCPARSVRKTGRSDWLTGSESFRELSLTFHAERRTVWQVMTPTACPSFTERLLSEMAASFEMVGKVFVDHAEDEAPIRYLVLASASPGVFNLGGDLALFYDLIQNRDERRLRAYAHACAHIQHAFGISLYLPIMTVALVQGDALGGGFEAALAQDVIIAERSATFGLPEILFNMFAGMGAYTFLCRRIHPAQAERLILSGARHGAEELAELGVVDRVVDDGAGEQAVAAFIQESDRQWNARRAMQRVRRHLKPIGLQELLDVVDIWVEAALHLTPSDLRRMQLIARAQNKRWSRRVA